MQPARPECSADQVARIILSNYAYFLETVRKDLDSAEACYKRALDADPEYAHVLANYGGLLLARGGRAHGADCD